MTKHTLTESLIYRAAYVIGMTSSCNDPILKIKLEYNPFKDIGILHIRYKDAVIHHELAPNDTSMSLDDFLERILISKLNLLVNSETQFDDCGQVI